MRITVVGLGHMGSALAVRLAGAGQEVRVWNRSPGKAGDAVAAGAVEAPSLEEGVAGADVVLTMLSDDAAVRGLVLGDGGLGRLVEGAGGVYVDSSTVSPGLSAELAGAIGRYAAMPVLGSPEAVTSGQATLLLGGTEAALGAAREVARAVSERVAEVGTAPQTLAAKVTSNYLLLAGLPVLAEAFEIARAGGLDDETIGALLKESPLVAPGLRNRFDAVLTGSREGWFSTALGGKDVGLGLALAGGAGRRLEIATAVEALYERAASSGLGDADVAAIGLLYRGGVG